MFHLGSETVRKLVQVSRADELSNQPPADVISIFPCIPYCLLHFFIFMIFVGFYFDVHLRTAATGWKINCS
jgi:hypothetical protein